MGNETKTNASRDMIIDWRKDDVPLAQLYDVDGVKMPGYICAVCLTTGWIKAYVCDGDGEILTTKLHDDVIFYEFCADAPLRIEWKDPEAGRAYMESKGSDDR